MNGITRHIDKFGAFASALCAVHCAAVGLAMAVLPVLGLTFLADPRTEAVFIGTAVVLGVWAIVAGYRRHRNRWPAVLFLAGLVLVAASHLGHGHAHGVASAAHVHGPGCVHREPWAAALAVLGGLTLVAFHVVNHRLGHHACACIVCTASEPDATPAPRRG